MDCKDFNFVESDLRAIIRARDLGKNAALVSNLRPNASDPRLPVVREASDDNAPQ